MLVIKYSKKLYESKDENVPDGTRMLDDDVEVEVQYDKKKYNVKIGYLRRLITDAKNQIRGVCVAIDDMLDKKTILFVDDYQINSMATDGRYIYINPAFCFRLYKMDNDGTYYISYVLSHEAMHILRRDRISYERNANDYPDFDRVNKAQDAVINYWLENLIYADDGDPMFTKGTTEICGGVINEKWGEKGYDWMEIYPLVPQELLKPFEKKKMSDEWNKGFVDGFKEYLKQLRSQNLIERYI